jgi:tRNA threonylcarbamoyladenosine biosynthesis protein TsaB
MLLALETANDQCSVTLVDLHGRVLATRHDDRAREQTRLLLPMIDAVLGEVGIQLPQLSAIAFSRGPGSFSGIRINAAVTQALAWAHDLPVLPISTLHATAQAALNQTSAHRIMVVLDARMNEVYVAAYQREAAGMLQQVGAEQLLAYAAVQMPAEWQDDVEVVWVGSGVRLLPHVLPEHCFTTVNATAVQIAQLGLLAYQTGQTVPALHALPVYLRDDAWKKLADQGRPASVNFE